MPENTINIPDKTWTLISSNNISTARIQNQSKLPIYLKATVGAVAPTNNNGALIILPSQIIPADMDLATLFPGVSGANRLYAYCVKGGVISVSHI